MKEKKNKGNELLERIQKESANLKETNAKLEAELNIARKELAFQNEEKGKRAAELGIANKELEFQDEEKEKRAAELGIANIELAFQDEEKGKRAAELGIANIELAFQDEEKGKRAAELGIANKELAFQDEEKEKRAAELGIANKELAFQDEEKEKRAAELIIANKELLFQNEEKEKRAAELIIANEELAFQNNEKEKRAAELIKLNEDLKAKEQQLSNQINAISKSNATIEFDLNGVIVSVSQSFLNMMGYTEEEIVGKHHSIFVDKSHAISKVYQDFWESLKRGEYKKDEFKRIDKNGKHVWLLGSYNPILDAAGKPSKVLKIATDVTLVKRQVEELALQSDEKEKRAAELIIANKELAFQNNEKEKRAAELIIANEELVFQNNEKEKRAAELSIANKELAFQNDEKEKRAQELIIANKELAFQNDEKEKRAAELSIANKELAFQNDEKEKRAQELIVANKELAFQNDEKEKRAAELFMANKELIFETGEKEKRAAERVIADIELAFQNKEKEKREAANKELEALSYAAKLASQYSLSLIEASLDPLVTINTEGKITDMNQALVNITGIPRQDLTGTDFFDYFTDPQKAREVYEEVFAKGSVADYPLTLRHKRGKLTDVLFNGSVYKDGSGNVLGVVIVARDVTDQKRIATELLEAKEFAELASKSAEEAKIKAESAAVIAENAVKAKQQFLSNMSHEIRTPMNAIIGFTKVVLKTELSVKQKEYLSAIKISGDALIVLINDILDLAKVDAGKMTFEQIPFKMSASISAMLHLFEPKIHEKNLELVKKYDQKIPEVLLGDPVRLHQIILNLVSNAVKFTSEGKITVSVDLFEEDEEKVIVQFSVQDTGIGIPNDKRGNIFENFQQASSGTSRLYGGTGLGLAIVKQLVEPQGGQIKVDSIVGEGSTFSFTLPFLKTKADAESDNGLIELDPIIKNLKVLVVEDIALNQLLMKTLLDDFGFELDIADNGKIALEKLKGNIYDIILMDLQMPVMNGFEATEYIRNTLKLTIPILALTADVTTVDLAKCKAVGMNDYLAKPIDERILYSKIMGLVKKNLPPGNKLIKEVPKIERSKLSLINLDYLKRVTKSDPIIMLELIRLCLEDTPALIEAMEKSVEQNDLNSLYSAVHKLIPSFAIIGISSVYENMAKELQEYAANKEKIEKIPGLVSEVVSVFKKALREVEEEYLRIRQSTGNML